MFYRYEAKKNDRFVGIFCVLNPSQRRQFNRLLKEPKWYANNPNVDSRCWFTEEGYSKYHSVIDGMISELRGVEIRILKRNEIQNIAMRSKIQCIELI